MRLFELGERLSVCVSFVRRGSRIADIGTDHGFLPIWLIKKGISPCAVATDINELPAEKARFNAEKYGVSDRLSVITTDGLAGVAPDSVDDIVAAGMGGEVIAGIINRAPWLRNERYRLILQPMSRSEMLRDALLSGGFDIEEEKTLCDAGRVYTVMCAKYTGNVRKGTLTELYGGALLSQHDENSAYLLKKQARILRDRAKAFSENDEQYAELINAACVLEDAADGKNQ